MSNQTSNQAIRDENNRIEAATQHTASPQTYCPECEEGFHAAAIEHGGIAECPYCGTDCIVAE